MSTYTAPDSEKALLGCIAATEGALLDRIEIESDLFSLPKHQITAEAMVRLFQKNTPVTFLTVSQEISAEELKTVGGVPGLIDLCDFNHPSQADFFLKILQDKRVLRSVHNVLSWAQTEIQQTQDIPGFCAELQSKTTFVEAGTKSENLLLETIRNVSERLDAIAEGRKTLGLEVPLWAWNSLFGGLVQGQLYALAGRPGTGKTSLIEMFIAEMASHGRPVLVFEKDMSPEMLVERIACRLTGVPYWRYVRARLNERDIKSLRSAMDCLSRAPIHLYSPSGLTAERMCAITRREKRLHGIEAVFLDHIQVLNTGKELREGLTKASIHIRSCATETGIPHVVLAQLNREGAKGRPKPEDIKEFDQLYADCDCMAMLWSEKKAEDLGPNEKLPVNLYAAKNRNGPKAEEPLLFDGEMMKFDYESPNN